MRCYKDAAPLGLKLEVPIWHLKAAEKICCRSRSQFVILKVVAICDHLSGKGKK
jgi:hypothetical protein